MNKTAQMLKAARERLESQQETIEEQREKLAAFRREKVAEEIVDMKIANGATEPSNFLQERDRLVESDKDLQKTKTAMKEAGPGFTGGQSLVEDVDDGPAKEAASTEPSTSSKYAANAMRNLQKRASDIGAA
jgi:uncharacterized protein YdiU (UPF0061 family)